MGISLPFSRLTLKDDFSELAKPKVFSPVIMYTLQEPNSVADLNALLHITLVESEILENLKTITHATNFSSSSDQPGIAGKIVRKGLINVFTFPPEPIHILNIC